MTSKGPEASDDEWEEMILVAEVNGVLDTNLVRQAISQGNVTLRNPSESRPIIQISNSLYTGKWARTVGTDIILEATDNQVKVISTTDRYLKTEKALLTARTPANQAKNGQPTAATAAPTAKNKQSMKNAKAEK